MQPSATSSRDARSLDAAPAVPGVLSRRPWSLVVLSAICGGAVCGGLAAVPASAEDGRAVPEPRSVLVTVADPGPARARGFDLGLLLSRGTDAKPLSAPARSGVQRVSHLVLADDAPADSDKADSDKADKDKNADDPKKPAGPCGEAAVECREALEKLRLDALSSINLDIRVGGRAGNDYPCECRLEGADYEPRRFASTIFTWKAPGYCHKPLYFEHWALERYGHSRGFVADSFCSAAHFFVTLPVLPYKMGVELPWECVYPLGYYRPGNCAPWTVPAVPISGRGLAVQAATVTGLVFLLP
jgi:hypothetical protein